MMDGPPPVERPLDFDPGAALDWSPVWHPDVTLLPWTDDGDRGARRAAGLFDASGTFLPEGHCYRYESGPITIQPDLPDAADLPDPPERLAGRWLFGGLFYGHFGHFLVETTARLWALDTLGPIDGIVFFPKQKFTHERRHYRHQLPFFAALGIDEALTKIRVPQRPVVIEQLAIPAPAFGIERLIEARPEYRRYMRAALGRHVPETSPPTAPDKLYISRTALPSRRGSVMLENLMEDRMAQAGYTVFHPQDHDITAQIAAYAAASHIVSLDASALHLAAMVVGPDTRVAIINRGPSNNIADYVAQFTRWQGRAPTRIEAVTGFYNPEGTRVKKRETHAVLDHTAVGAALARDGFLPDGTRWDAPTTAQHDAALSALTAQADAPLVLHRTRG